MTRRAAFSQADVTRVIRGALKAGLPASAFKVEVVGGIVRLLPVAANEPSDPAQDAARRMREAFGD